MAAIEIVGTGRMNDSVVQCLAYAVSIVSRYCDTTGATTAFIRWIEARDFVLTGVVARSQVVVFKI